MNPTRSIRYAFNQLAASLPHPVIIENTDHQVRDALYISCFLLPADDDVISIDVDVVSQQGIYQLSINDKQRDGVSGTEEAIDNVMSIFNIAQTMQKNGVSVKILNISRGQGVREGGFFVTPIFIQYKSFN